MKIFDSHVHFWDLALKKHTWLTNNIENSFIGDYTAICKNYLPDDLLADMDGFELAGLTHVQAGWDSKNPVDETIWLNEIFEKNNLVKSSVAGVFPVAIVGYADLTDKNVESIFNLHAEHKNFWGIRQILNWNKNPYFSGCSKNIIENENFEKGFRLLKKFQMNFELQAYPVQLEKLIPLFQTEEKTKIMIEHCAMPLFFSQEDVESWKTVLKKAAQLPSVFIKLSGLDMFCQYSNEFLSKKDILDFCINTFGIKRCLFGSNFPVSKLYGNYLNTIKPILEIGLSAIELQQILYENALNIFFKTNECVKI